MRILLFPLIPLWVFFVFLIGKNFIKFADNNGDKWWGGFPLWMAGALGFLVPGLFAGLIIISSLIATGHFG